MDASAQYTLTHSDCRLARCNGRGCGAQFFVDRMMNVLRCTTCRALTCLLCNADAHEGMSCEDFARQGMIDMVKQSGLLMQNCPRCPHVWNTPVECLHVTCDERNGGCGHQFCFLCTASYSPIRAHADCSYHRPQCDLYTTCCNDDCIKNGLRHCKSHQYKPGPCRACRMKKSYNGCKHVKDWTPCNDCLRKQLECTHWCDECDRLGSLCAPPDRGDETKFRNISHQDSIADQEKQRRK